MDRVTLLLGALELFSTWSNTLLVVTVAGIGWVIWTREKFSRLILLRISLVCLAMSALFAIFTLALVPQVAELLTPNTASIYTVEPRFCLLFGELLCMGGVRFSYVVWPQHVLFLAGVGLFIWGTVERRIRPRPPGAATAPPSDEDEPPKRRTFDPNA
jgi:hypothetical protein